ncbi:MAG: tRNA 2-thiouridine(34) synthase MnmA [Holosporales bacterium]|jgi:tRNA-specific 2-thiouridylase|nr:tRNA 2-thiouridine(34) synthase MnmA [Holosporales bacterium]
MKIFVPDFCNKILLPPPLESVVLGMSGGVDSSSTAAILKANGNKVLGVFIELFLSESVEKAKKDAKNMAKVVGIDFEVIDYKQQFQQHVIEPFVEAYCSNQTPLPCSWCNRFIKFSALCEKADSISVKHVATGHYVKTGLYEGITTLERAKDRKQDQSYFLHKVEYSQLTRAVFPLGNASKRSVRDYAGQIGLSVAEKKSLYDICFLADFQGEYISFINTYIKKNPEFAKRLALQPGEILDKYGKKIGEHQGTFRYTIGQRRGMGIAAQNPLYVLKMEENRLIIGEKADLATTNVNIKNVNFHKISDFFLKKNEKNKVLAQFRSTTPATPATFTFSDSDYLVSFKDVQYGVSPGQAIVIRNENGTVLAGGTINN